MSKKIRFAVLLSALFAAGANAQPFAADMTRQQVQEDLAAWRQSGLEALSRGESGPDTFSPQYQAAFQRYLQLTQGDMYQAPSAGKTRAEVMADLELWKISGMHAFTSRGITTASHTQAYQQAYESYLQLKLGAAYKAPVALTRAQVKSDLADWQIGRLREWLDSGLVSRRLIPIVMPTAPHLKPTRCCATKNDLMAAA